MKTLKKWDSKIARGLLQAVTGSDAKQVSMLKAVAGNFSTTSMLRRVVLINRMEPKKRDAEIAELKLNSSQFLALYQVCDSLYENSWRPYTLEEEALYYATQEFHVLKKGRKVQEWAWQVGFLPEPERAHTACVIWWDIVGDTIAGDKGQFSKFDQWVIGFKNKQLLSTATLRKNLITCGYPELVAISRVDSDDDLIEETETETEAI